MNLWVPLIQSDFLRISFITCFYNQFDQSLWFDKLIKMSQDAELWTKCVSWPHSEKKIEFDIFNMVEWRGSKSDIHVILKAF